MSIRGLIVVVIPILYHSTGSLYAFYVTVFFLSLANLLFAPAKSAVIPEYFEPAQAPADQRDSLGDWASWGRSADFVVGGWLFDYHSWELSFYSDAASYLVSVVFLLPLLWFPRTKHCRPSPEVTRRRRRAGRPIGGSSGSFREALGLHTFGQARRVRDDPPDLSPWSLRGALRRGDRPDPGSAPRRTRRST